MDKEKKRPNISKGAAPNPETQSDASFRILVVDDDPQVREVIVETLVRAGFEVLEADSGVVMRRLLARESADLVVLDVKMPEEDGLRVLRTLRRSSRVPVLFLSVAEQPHERAEGLEEGADDYLGKPFVPRELVARVRAILERTQMRAAPRGSRDRLEFHGFCLDLAHGRLTDPKGSEIALTHSESEILKLLLEHPYETLSRDMILRRTLARRWSPNDRSLDVLISRLRRKIEPPNERGKWIHSVRGVGYTMRVKVERKQSETPD